MPIASDAETDAKCQSSAESEFGCDTGRMSRKAISLVALAWVAAAGTVWYLSGDFPAQIPLVLVALVVLAVPLALWLRAGQYARIIATWAAAGVIGAYIFGVLILAAAVLGAAVLGMDRCRQRFAL